MRILHQRIIVLVLALSLVSYAQELPPDPTTDSDKNWSSSVSYDLLGNTLSKEVSFYNTLVKGIQTQSWDLLTNKIWASHTMY